MLIFSEYKSSGFDIKWVDDTHCLVVFSNAKIGELKMKIKILSLYKPGYGFLILIVSRKKFENFLDCS